MRVTAGSGDGEGGQGGDVSILSGSGAGATGGGLRIESGRSEAASSGAIEMLTPASAEQVLLSLPRPFAQFNISSLLTASVPVVASV